MVEVAPIPSDFPPPAEAPRAADLEANAVGGDDHISAAAPHPLEAWGPPPSPFEQPTRHDLPGGSGYLTATRTALQRLADGEARIRQMAGPGIRHASEIAAEQRQREDQAEAARRAAPDPRGVLHAAIAMRSEAAAEVDRLTGPLTRARQLVEDLERRQQEHAAAVVAGDDASAARLIEVLAADEESMRRPCRPHSTLPMPRRNR
jgi:hypothetical protein